MNTIRTSPKRRRNVCFEENSVPPIARFAISAMDGKFQMSESQLKSKFMAGLISLVQNDPLCALEKLLSSSGSICLQNAITIQMDASYWKQYIIPILKALSADELQLGCREQLTTSVFQHMMRTPFFLQKLYDFLDDDIVDPLLALSIVDRAGTADRSFMEDRKFMNIVKILGKKLNGPMRDHLIIKFKDGADDCDSAHSVLHDTSLKTLQELKFDRHDNDFESIADVELLPTKQELECIRDPYLPLASNPMNTAISLFDTHFRWLREDMIGPIRESIALLQSDSAVKKDEMKARLVKRLRARTFGPIELDCLTFDKHGGTGFAVWFPHPVPFKTRTESELSEVKLIQLREKYYDKYWKTRPRTLRRGAVVVFVRQADGAFVRFGEILDGNRPNQALHTNPTDGKTRVIVQIEGTQFPSALLDMITQRSDLLMVQIEVSFFAYKPILKRLQQMKIPHIVTTLLPGQLCSSKDQRLPAHGDLNGIDKGLKEALERLNSLEKSQDNIKSILPHCSAAKGAYTLDKQQCMAVGLAFSTPVSLIQGPPGTGKSLCGAVIGALLHRFTTFRILCLCYTNHALDDFLNDLIKIGVPDSDILRLGSGCRADPGSPVANTRLDEVRRDGRFPSSKRPLRRLMAETHTKLLELKEEASNLYCLAQNMTKKQWKAVKEYFLEHEAHMIDAFSVNSAADGFQIAGISEDRLWKNWISGNDPPHSVDASVCKHELWDLPQSGRDELLAQWIKDAVSQVAAISTRYDRESTRLQELYDEETSLIIRSRRIIGCTTTGASSFARLLNGATVDVLIMEEAGEILEAHSLAAIGNRIRQIVLIGDHLQLRPKIENHLLGTESSQGRYTLDVSLFERLIQNGVPYVTLEQQHRMCQSVAAFVTQLTYPSLRTAPTVKRRKLVGAPHNVVFVNHSGRETSPNSLQSLENSVSHLNENEVEWVVAITRYLLCQLEYSADDIVVLTPYLGQVLLLRNALEQLSNIDVRMNERDIANLIKAGKELSITDPTTINSNFKPERKRIRVATVDNFQGEEGNIVIASLVRSNDNGAIGFVAQPQRINVLLSRAREAMIFIGNSSTLMGSKKGGNMWKKIIEIFDNQGTVDQGFAVTCAKHGTHQLIMLPEEFAEKAPDGGCDLPCDAKLKCGHSCALKCHRGPCSQACRECAKQKKLQLEQERMARRKEELISRNQQQREKLQHELDCKRELLLEKQDEQIHIMEVERLKLENELLEKEFELMKKTSVQIDKSRLGSLRKRYAKKRTDLEASFADPSSRGPESVKTQSTAQFERAKRDEQATDMPDGKCADVRYAAVLPHHSDTGAAHSESASEDDSVLTLEEEWQHVRLKVSRDQRVSMDKLMKLIGLPAVKKIALEVFKKQLTDQRLKADGLSNAVVKSTLNFSFVGNPGTGKTTVAGLFAKILVEAGTRRSSRFENVTASELLRFGEENFVARISSMCGSESEKGPPLGMILRRNLKIEVQGTDNSWYAAKIIEVDEEKKVYTVEYASDGSEEKMVTRNRIRAGSELRKEGGVLFIDEAYDLAPSRNKTGAAIVNILMEVAEKYREKLTIILAGYQKDIENELFAFNDGMPSRFREVVFDDFDETDLRRIWKGLCTANGYLSDTKVTEVAARYVGRGRGVRGFGNARSVRSVFEQACSRSSQRRTGRDLQITASDVLGKRPSFKDSQVVRVMDELHGLIGLSRVKDSFKSLIQLAISNYNREMKGLPQALVPLNRVFVGNPGTGKTTVARLYGALLKTLGFLSNGEVVPKVASDLMGQYIGESQQRTKAIVENARGKVLLIDEAYGLDDKMYGKQALDTIVERVSGAPGEDIAVVLVGYEEQIRKMIDGQNPGLKRRFNMEICKILFDDFNEEEIHTLVGLECRKSGVTINGEVHKYATKLLMKQRAKPNFGNAGNVVSLIKSAIGRLTSRTAASADNAALSIRDIDPTFEPNADPLAPLDDLEDTPVRGHLLDLALQLQVRIREGRNTEGVVGNYVFTGAPGTGKTTVARKLAKVLFNMGVLASDLVVETSSSDLIGSYIGHSRENVEKAMKEARGGVCFIDEAYQLGAGPFGIEALTQLLTMLTLPEYMDGKTIIVLAGYDKEIHKMLESNPGLKSRFASYLRFEDWTPMKCVSFVCKLAAKERPLVFSLDGQGKDVLCRAFEQIQNRPGWANARDAIQLYKRLISARDIRRAKGSSSTMTIDPSLITTEDIDKAVSEFLQARPDVAAPKEYDVDPLDAIEVQMKEGQDQTARPRLREQENFSEKEQVRSSEVERPRVVCDDSDDDDTEDDQKNSDDDEIGEGHINDRFYTVLLGEVIALEKQFPENSSDGHAKGCKAERERLEREKREHDKLLEEKKLAEKRARAVTAERERKRLFEIARKKEEELQRKLAKERNRQKVRHALMTIGKCVAGFRWLRQGSGYRCAGGNHYARFEDIAKQTGLSVEEVQNAFKE